MKKNRFIILPATVLMIALLSISCSDKEPEDTLPELPPVDALLMDFSEFIDNPSQMQALKSMDTYQNAMYSYFTVSIFSVLVTVPMIIPVAAYLESFKHTPVYLGDNTWQWSYSVSGGTDPYTGKLVTKRISNDEFTAEMFVSKSGAFEDFKWFEGSIRYDRTHAEWIMYQPSKNESWLEIEWNKDWEKGTSDLTYTFTSGDAMGSFITMGITEDTDYDAYFVISAGDKETSIKWNRTSKIGRVLDEVNFQDDVWHCWSEYFLDEDCN